MGSLSPIERRSMFLEHLSEERLASVIHQPPWQPSIPRGQSLIVFDFLAVAST